MELAGAWIRVSTREQDEASQLPDIIAHIERHGYEHKATYEVHGASARKGNRKFDQAWQGVLDDFRTEKITVLVVWYLSRLDRKLEATRMIADVVKLGGRIEFAKQPHLNNLSTMAGRISLTIEQEIAYAESQEKSDRIKANFDRKRVTGSAFGRPPWGYKIETVDDKLKFIPTDEGRHLIPVIYQMVLDGKTLKEIADFLEEQTCRKWPVLTVGRMVKRTVYMGLRLNSGNLETEALVTPTVWHAANEALSARAGERRESYSKLLVLYCGSPDCNASGTEYGQLSPMYLQAKTRGDKTYSYYRCTGRVPRQKGCGMTVPASVIEDMVQEAVLDDMSPLPIEQFIPGDSNADELAKLQEALNAAMRSRNFREVARLGEEAEKLSQQPSRPGKWITWLSDTETVGGKFSTLDFDGKRQFLAQYEIRAWKDEGGPRFTMAHKSFLAEPVV